MHEEIHNAFEIIKNGGIILYPTDTVWAIGCDATNEEAVNKIYNLLKKDKDMGMICLMNSEKMIYNVFKNIPEVAWEILDVSEKPTSLILDKPRNVAKNLIAADDSLGFRIVKAPFCFKLMERMKKPLVATIAKFSGSVTPKTFKEIDPKIIKGVDYTVNLYQDKVCKNQSTIIKLGLDSQVKVIRN